MNKIKSLSAGQVQDAPKASRRENGVTLGHPGSHLHLFNGVVESGGGGEGKSFPSIGERDGSMSNFRPTATSNSSTFEDRKHTGAGEESAGATACSYVHEGRKQPQKPAPQRTNGAGSASKYIDSRTTPIVRMLFHSVFTQANLDQDVIRRLDVDSVVKALSQPERSFVYDTCEKYLEYIRIFERLSIDSHRRAVEATGWEVTDNNVNAEFKKVVNQTFDEDVSWGNVISFLGFALGFSVFIHNRGMKKAVISVAEWTKQVIEEDIGSFFLEHNGWDGFREVVETLLKRQKRKLREEERSRTRSDTSASDESPTFWQNTAAVASVAVGAAVLFGLKQAFS